MSNSGIQIIKAFFYLAFFSFFLLSCSVDPAPPVVISKKSTVKKKVKTPPPQKKVLKKKAIQKRNYIYNPSGKRDPFLPFIARVSEEVEEELVPKTELQEYELSQLKLVALMTIGAKQVAMVEDPKGKGHVLKIGTLIGKNKGKVLAIKAGIVLIEEKYRDILGEIKSTIKELVIKAPEGGK